MFFYFIIYQKFRRGDPYKMSKINVVTPNLAETLYSSAKWKINK
jgi:hypothetical protein